MAAARRVMELEFTEEELADLERVSRSRTEPASHVQRARILLGYRQTPSLYATGRAIGVTHQTVERCLRRARDLGVKAALDDRPRPGRERTISCEARTFVVDLACREPKDSDYPHEVWTTRLLTARVRERGPQVGHACLARLSQGTLCKILAAHEIKPHKVKYYLQNRAPEFAEKMAEALEVYREVETLKVAARAKRGTLPQSRLFLVTRSLAYRRSRPRRPTCLPSRKFMRLLRAIKNTSPGNHEPAGRPRSGDRRRSRPRRRKTLLARVLA